MDSSDLFFFVEFNIYLSIIDSHQVELWKIKKLIKSLQQARGNGTSMISLIIPPKDQVSRVGKMLADEVSMTIS